MLSVGWMDAVTLREMFHRSKPKETAKNKLARSEPVHVFARCITPDGLTTL